MELNDKINSIVELCGNNQQIIIRKLLVGKRNPIEGALVYKEVGEASLLFFMYVQYRTI